MFAGKTILYIEDEMLVADMILDELREAGAKCIHSVEYKDAVSKANFQKYDLILTDIRIKEGFGNDLVDLIKTNPKHVNFNTPVIVTSAYISKELELQLKDFVKCFLRKPHTVAVLIEVIEKIFRNDQ